MMVLIVLGIDNTIEEKGEDLGSEDTDNDDDEGDEYEEEEYESDGFIVNDDDHVSVASSHDIDENIDDDALVQPKRRRSRIILQSSSDESDSDENSNDTTTGVVLIPLEQVEVSVAVEVNANVGVELAVENFVEGKKFPTTFLVQDDEKNVEKITSVAKIDKPGPSTEQSTGQSIELSIEPVFEVSSNQSKSEEVEEGMDVVTTADVSTQSDGPNESIANEERIEKDDSVTMVATEIDTQSDEPNESLTEKENVEKDATIEQATVKVPRRNSNKANKSITQTENIEISVEPDSVSQQTTQPDSSNIEIGAVELENVGQAGTSTERKSLSNLDTSRTAMRSMTPKNQNKEPKTGSKKNVPSTAMVEPDTIENDSPRSNDSVNSNASNHVPLNISSQEENNNRKIGKGISIEIVGFKY